MERFEDRDRVLHDMKVLYPTESPAEKVKEYYENKKRFFLLVLGAGIVTIMLMEVSALLSPVIQEDNRIKRNPYETGDRTVYLKAYYDEGTKEEDIRLEVNEQQYTAAEVEKMLNEVANLLPVAILGENASFDEVRSNLKLVSKIEGYPFDIRWEIDNYRIINRYGEIREDKTEKEGTLTEVKAIITYADYSAESTFHIRIYPPIQDREEVFLGHVEEELSKRESESLTDAEVRLPKEVDGTKIIWREAKDNTSICILFLVIVAAVVLYYGKDSELHTQVKRRKREMEIDYAEIVSKLVLFLGAGMTVKGAWQQIVNEYITLRETGMKKRYAYEEMRITHYEMSSGISEIKAYERFGSRSDLPRYQILASIVGQGVRRGTQGTIELLLREMTDAFEERKSIAKQLGEEAGTKLLIPMFMMLMIVMLIIILPAFMSLQVVS